MPPRPSPDASSIKSTPIQPQKPDAAPSEGQGDTIVTAAMPPTEPETGTAPPGPHAAGDDRLARLEKMVFGLTEFVERNGIAGRPADERLDARFADMERMLRGLGMHVQHLNERVDAGRSADEPVDDTPPEDRVRPDELLLPRIEGLTRAELLRALELHGAAEDAARWKAAGVSPETHIIANDCMAIGVLDADGKEVQTKVMPGDPIPLKRLSPATIEWGLKHPEGPKFARPGEYKAPKQTPPHTR